MWTSSGLNGFFRRTAATNTCRLEGIHLHIGSPIYSPDPYVQAIEDAVADRAAAERRFHRQHAGHRRGLRRRLRVGQEPGRGQVRGGDRSAAQGARPGYHPGTWQADRGKFRRAAGERAVHQTGRRAKFRHRRRGHERPDPPGAVRGKHFIWPTKLAAATAPERRIDLANRQWRRWTWSGASANRAISLPRTACCRPWLAAICWPCSRQAAYGFVMSSQYNSRPRAAEVLVDGRQWRIVRRRETYEDLTAAEQ